MKLHNRITHTNKNSERELTDVHRTSTQQQARNNRKQIFQISNRSGNATNLFLQSKNAQETNPPSKFIETVKPDANPRHKPVPIRKKTGINFDSANFFSVTALNSALSHETPKPKSHTPTKTRRERWLAQVLSRRLLVPDQRCNSKREREGKGRKGGGEIEGGN